MRRYVIFCKYGPKEQYWTGGVSLARTPSISFDIARAWSWDTAAEAYAAANLIAAERGCRRLLACRVGLREIPEAEDAA